MLILAIGVWLSAIGLLIVSATLVPIFIGFCGLGAGESGYRMGAQTIILEFGSRDDMPMRIAAATTAEATTASAGPLLGGVLADQFGFVTVFSIAGMLLVGALALLFIVIREPRTSDP